MRPQPGIHPGWLPLTGMEAHWGAAQVGNFLPLQLSKSQNEHILSWKGCLCPCLRGPLPLASPTQEVRPAGRSPRLLEAKSQEEKDTSDYSCLLDASTPRQPSRSAELTSARERALSTPHVGPAPGEGRFPTGPIHWLSRRRCQEHGNHAISSLAVQMEGRTQDSSPSAPSSAAHLRLFSPGGGGEAHSPQPCHPPPLPRPGPFPCWLHTLGVSGLPGPWELPGPTPFTGRHPAARGSDQVWLLIPQSSLQGRWAGMCSTSLSPGTTHHGSPVPPWRGGCGHRVVTGSSVSGPSTQPSQQCLLCRPISTCPTVLPS